MGFWIVSPALMIMEIERYRVGNPNVGMQTIVKDGKAMFLLGGINIIWMLEDILKRLKRLEEMSGIIEAVPKLKPLIEARTKEDLKLGLEAQIKKNVPNMEVSKATINLKLGCGCVRRFKNIDEVPLVDIKCFHGNYFIKILEK